MAYKSTGKAGKSASGASMSKYDVEVESRLQKLEAQAHPTPTGATQKSNDDRLTALENVVAALQADSHPDRGTTVVDLIPTGEGMTPECQEMYQWYNRVKRLI